MLLLQGAVGVPSPIFVPPPIQAPVFPPPAPLSPELQALERSSNQKILISSTAMASGIMVVVFIKYWHDKRMERKKRESPIESDAERNRRMSPNKRHVQKKHY
jgi:hypothetical protein